MPKVSYNDPKVQKLYGGYTKTLRLKTKGETIKFVLGATEPTMYGLHWFDRKPYQCDRVNKEKDCKECQVGFDALKVLKDLKLDTESKEYKKLKKQAMDHLPNINFYYPIFVTGGSWDRGAYVLETVKTIYQRFGDLQDKGKDLLGLEWQIDRTEKPGSYYILDDVGELPQLTADELEELQLVTEMDIDQSMNYPTLEERESEANGVETDVRELTDEEIADFEKKLTQEEEDDGVVKPPF